MWKRGGRSSALERVQALLSTKRSSRGDTESVYGSTAATWEHKGAVGRSAHSNPRNLLSDLSDLSSVSSAPEHVAGAVDSPAAVGKTLGREGDSIQDVRPQSSLGGGGSRFLKKAPPPATNSSQSPVSKMQQVFEPRNVSSSLRSSQTAALSRLAQIESRISSRNQAGQGPKTVDTLISDLGMSPPLAAQPLEAPVQLSVQSSSEHNLRGKRFLKYDTAVALSVSNPAAQAPQGPHVGFRSRSKTADAIVSSVGSETKALNLESDEEDMRKLLGDCLDSPDNNFLIPVKPSPRRTADKMLSKRSQKVHSASPGAVVTSSPSSNTAAPRSPAPPHPNALFQFTGEAEAHFSPSALSSSPSFPCLSPSPMGRLNSPLQTGGSQRSLSSMSRYSEVLSLEELFPVGPASAETHSERSAVSSEAGQQDFEINVITLDDLLPATLGFTEETPGEEREYKLGSPLPGSPNRPQLQRLKKKKGEEQKQEEKKEEENVLEYQSNFESETRTEPDNSACQVSDYLQGHGDGEEVVLEVREEASNTDVSCGRAENNYSSIFSDKGCSYSSQTSDRSQTCNRSTDFRSSSTSSVSHSSQNSSHQSRGHAFTRTLIKEAAVQTQPDTWLTGMALGPAVSMAYMDATPVVTHSLSAEMVEALSTFNPAIFALNEFLKQQLAMTRQFIERSQHLHSSLLQSLEPPNHRYTTLEHTKEYICKHRPPNLKEASEEILQEMRDHHHT